ncbi:MAG TPA: hypothetical protein PLT74_11415, partial [Kiritimatiellia bacterium]|nr:hypothetical protein [Kiritimatiellia bacterium]
MTSPLFGLFLTGALVVGAACGDGFATSSRLEHFLGEPFCEPAQTLWQGRGGWGGIVAARDGT